MLGGEVLEKLIAKAAAYDDCEWVSVTLHDLRGLRIVKDRIESLEALRPIWAQGFTSDGVSAQVIGVALTSLWQLLGVKNQTEAHTALKALVERQGEHERRVNDLLEANNRYLQEARDARAALRDAQQTVRRLQEFPLAIWETATNAVCQSMQDDGLCSCESGACAAVKIDPSQEDRAAWDRYASGLTK